MAHKRGPRNPKSCEFRNQWHDACHFVSQQAFVDRPNGESICQVTVDDVALDLAEKFDEPIPEAVPDVEPGLVLSNRRGEGAFQTMEMDPALEAVTWR